MLESDSVGRFFFDPTVCIGNDCDTVLNGERVTGRCAQFDLTLKSKRGLASSDAGEAVDPPADHDAGTVDGFYLCNSLTLASHG